MSAPLADALRRLGLPLDETIDDGELGDAYRRAARENHPDGAPDSEREQRGETMRAINAARDLVRKSLELLSERAYTELSERDNGTPAPAWWEDAIFEDPSGLGVRWNPARCASPGASASSRRGSRSASPSATASRSSMTGMLTLGRVEAFDSSVRVSRRTAGAGCRSSCAGSASRSAPGRLGLHGRRRRRAGGGLALPRVRADEHARRAARAALPALHPAFAHRLRALGTTSVPPALPATPPALDRVATPFSPRRSPAFRDVDDGLADARRRVESLAATVDAMDAALASAEAGVAEAELRVARTRTRGRAPPPRALPPRRRGQARAVRTRLASAAWRARSRRRRSAPPGVRVRATRSSASATPASAEASAASSAPIVALSDSTRRRASAQAVVDIAEGGERRGENGVATRSSSRSRRRRRRQRRPRSSQRS